MPKNKTIDISCVNRIKYESKEEFDNSLFSEVYYRASRLVCHIIRQNQDKDYVPDREFCRDEQLNNVIAFLGERGVGKSSAMLSFALFLKNGNTNELGRYRVSGDKDRTVFSVLPRIDVAMMVKGERLLDVVLAQMWDAFEAKYRLQAGWKEDSLEKVKEHFRKVKRDYAIYLSTIADEIRITKTSSIEELHNLAAALNLKAEIKQLVDCYLECMLGDGRTGSGSRYLVLAIDDLDLADENVYDILEQLRIFLVIPNVIVLITADMERMTAGCVKNVSGNMCSEIYEDEVNRKLYHDAEKYVNNYLAKIIPQNMRVEMPDIRKMWDECSIYIDGLEQVIYGLNEVKAARLDNEKKILLAIIYRWTGILFSAKQSKRHYLQGSSLRKMVNNLYEMSEALKDEGVDSAAYVVEWLQSQLTRLYAQSAEIQSIQERDLLKELRDTEAGNYNRTFVNYYLDHEEEMDLTGEWLYDYGEVLFGLSRVSEKTRRLIALLYSLQLRKQMNECAEADIYIGENIFQEMIRRRPSGIRESRSWGYERRNSGYNEQEIDQNSEFSQIGNKLSIKLVLGGDITKSKDIEKLLIENAESVLQGFWIANLCDGETWEYMLDQNNRFELRTGTDTQSEGLDDWDSAPYITIHPLEKSFTAGWCLDNIFFGAIQYEQRLSKYFDKLYDAICGQYQIETPARSRNMIRRRVLDAWNIDEYHSWRDNNGISSIMDLLPLQSVGLMYEIACGLKTFRIINYDKTLRFSFYERLEKRMDYIIEALEDAENYVGMEYMGVIPYSQKLREYFEFMKIFELPEDKAALINTLDQLESEDESFDELF